MKVLFFGSSELSVFFLNEIYKAGHEVILAVTRPDAKTGRGRKLCPNPVKTAAVKHGIDFYELNVFDEDFYSLMKSIKYDIIVVVSFGKIFPARFFDIAGNNTINVHPSILPKYRGPSPIISALLNGDEITGVSLVKVSRVVDTGEIYEINKIPILKEDNHKSLENKIIATGTKMLVNFLDRFEKKKPISKPQGQTGASYTRMFGKNDTVIDWNKSPGEIFNMVRAFSPDPGCITSYNKKIIKIIWAKPVKLKSPVIKMVLKPGEIVKADRDGLIINCGKKSKIHDINNDDYLKLETLKPQNKNEINYLDFINGYRARPGDFFEKP
ncbi:MAG: methionyl-tRNA formyltransferase [Actinobacteria bacterium]|nr:methionyl-tRNA formyltransferase [Actinomycetota bacterium]